jgi:predicted DsbA family dithiol-disulfide isomerase
MDQQTPLQIDYFTDLLCVWAYGAQIRVDKLKEKFGNQINISPRFVSLFGDITTKIGKGWAEKGGYDAFNRQAHDVCAQWDHVTLHDDIWSGVTPISSMPAHLLMKSLQLWHANQAKPSENPEIIDLVAWKLRCAFFQEAQDIAHEETLEEIINSFNLPWKEIVHFEKTGEAHAELHRDMTLSEEFRIPGSPALVLNEGRQMLYGNVGYRVIEANIVELLQKPAVGEPSWC